MNRSTREQLQSLVRELALLRHLFPGQATPGWLQWAARTIWQLEATGATRFGGPDVLAWWLVRRCLPRERLTKAKVRQLQRGWSFLQVCSYVSCLKQEREAIHG